MPLGPGWSTFTPGDPFSPDSIADRFGELENWVNGSINEEDLKTVGRLPPCFQAGVLRITSAPSGGCVG